jgi:CheY-like chemotaxis protein
MNTPLKKTFEILSVDDDPDMLTVFAYLMKMRGYHVTVSHNAKDFWEILGDKKPDLIFLDIFMQGINGIDLCKSLKSDAATRDIPIVLLSGNENVKEIAASCNADGYLTKPFIIKEVIAEIRRLVAVSTIPSS